jgi:hypothetical protein
LASVQDSLERSALHLVMETRRLTPERKSEKAKEEKKDKDK